MVVCNTFLALDGAMLITFSWSLCPRTRQERLALGMGLCVGPSSGADPDTAGDPGPWHRLRSGWLWSWLLFWLWSNNHNHCGI